MGVLKRPRAVSILTAVAVLSLCLTAGEARAQRTSMSGQSGG
jgi:hypothetical protein